MRRIGVMLAVSLLLAAAVACTDSGDQGGAALDRRDLKIRTLVPPALERGKGLAKIDHLIFLVMENRSFDHYFGTYPGADGIPPDVCVPDPLGDACVAPYHDIDDRDAGGPHARPASIRSINGGRMDGFIEALIEQRNPPPCALDRSGDSCELSTGPGGQPDIMGYHTRDELPVYWEYADRFVLQDRMFGPSDSWTLPAHLYLVSAWMAGCSDHSDPMSCRPVSHAPGGVGTRGTGVLEERTKADPDPYAWTDITWLLRRHHVSWRYYVEGEEECIRVACAKAEHRTNVNQNPLPGFATVRDSGQLKNIRPVADYFAAAEAGTLPSVSWVMPPIGLSEHPGTFRSVIDGQRFVTEVVNASMEGPEWGSTAIFITWDDWGGFYDHVRPPKVDRDGYGLRVPGLMLSPYAKEGFIDHQTLSFDAYLKLIEDRFMGGARLDPETDGRPDPRTTVREEVRILGDLRDEFDFDQPPRPGVVVEMPA